MHLSRTALLGLTLAGAAAAPATAADLVVTRYDDPVPDDCLVDDCSLREAVIAANAATGLDRVLLSAGVYQLELVGTSENLAADGDLDTLFQIEIVGAGPGITVIDGDGIGEPIFAAVTSGTSFTLRGVTLRNADSNALILARGLSLVEDCEMTGAGGTFAGISLAINADATIRRVTSSGNGGRGLSVTQASALVENLTVTDNGVNQLAVHLATSFSCTHCTIRGAVAGQGEVSVSDSDVVFANTIVSGDCGIGLDSTLTSLGGNIESGGATCTFVHGTDQQSVAEVDLDLGALADNGGPTRTMLPGGASVAVGAANDDECLAEDQRGVARTTACESGAVELTVDPVATPIFRDGFLQGDTEAWSTTIGAS
jgi:CSLREA domain-containing protein